MEPQRFLQVLAQALSTMGLYKAGHPARERVIDRAFALLQELQTEEAHPDFSFLGDEVIFGKLSVPELRDWDWSRRFVEIGVQRLEFEPEVTRDDFFEFLDDVAVKFATPGGRVVVDTAEARQTGAVKTIRYGPLGIRSDTEEGRKVLEKAIVTATISYQMNEEIDAIKYMHDAPRSACAVLRTACAN